MKYIVEVMAVYCVDTEDMRDAQKLGYLKGMDIYDNDVDCVQTQVYSVSDEATYNRHKEM